MPLDVAQMEDLTSSLGAHEYETKTQGTRRVEAARSLGEGQPRSAKQPRCVPCTYLGRGHVRQPCRQFRRHGRCRERWDEELNF